MITFSGMNCYSRMLSKNFDKNISKEETVMDSGLMTLFLPIALAIVMARIKKF